MGQDLALIEAHAVATADQLPLTGGSLTVTKASEECSAGLWRRLTARGEGREIIREIGLVPALRDECKAVADRLAVWQRPCGAHAVVEVLVPLISVYRDVGEKSEGEWAAFWTIYIDALAVLPRAALEAAVVAYNQQRPRPGWTPGFPKPSELYALAEQPATEVRTVAWRARKVAEFEPPRERKPLTPEQRQELVDAGIMDANGKVIFTKARGIESRMVGAPRAETPQEMAERIRAAAAADEPEEAF